MKKPVATTDVKAIAAYYMIEKAKELLHEPAQPCSRAAVFACSDGFGGGMEKTGVSTG